MWSPALAKLKEVSAVKQANITLLLNWGCIVSCCLDMHIKAVHNRTSNTHVLRTVKQIEAVVETIDYADDLFCRCCQAIIDADVPWGCQNHSNWQNRICCQAAAKINR